MWSCANGQVVITSSSDAGRTWTPPEPIPLPSGSQGGRMFQVAVDAVGQLHVFLSVRMPVLIAFTRCMPNAPAMAAGHGYGRIG